MLSTREKRGIVETLSKPQGLLAMKGLYWVEDGTLYANGLPTGLTGLKEGEKQMVAMGAYLLIFPDKVYINSSRLSDFGSLEADFSYQGTVSYSLCDLEGQSLEKPGKSDVEPENPRNGQLWYDTGSGQLMQFSAASGLWSGMDSVYTKVSFTTQGELPRLFAQYDGVELEGLDFEELNGSKIIYGIGEDYIILVGLTDSLVNENADIRIRRVVPDMDFVCQCQNRLWGCRYGNDGEKNLNEIYCSALGDFKNFHQFLGLSTDSWVGSVGSEGEFTGAVCYLDSPCFFKEGRIHRVSVSPYGGHRVSETVCRGVQKGSHKSLVVLGDCVYYKSPGDVCVWQGGFPQTVSAALAEESFSEAVAGAFRGRLYISMLGKEGRSLYVLDTAKGIWYREDDLDVLCFAGDEQELYCLTADGRILAMLGSRGETEEDFDWSCTSGVLHYNSSNRKYTSRYRLSLQMKEGSELQVLLRYDSKGDWLSAGRVKFNGTGTIMLPVRPRRCDHLEMKLQGRGEVKLFSITKILEQGSDV